MNIFWKEFSKGLWKEIPPFRLMLGLCPVLAVTKDAGSGFGMGIAVLFVLTLSNMLVSAVRDIIPSKVRIACFVTISASLVVAVELLMQAYAYPLYQKLGIFVPLIVVNCIILGRAEAFAAKNPILLSVADGLGIGLGFTMSLTFLGALREILGTGMIFGHFIMWEGFRPLSVMVEAPGAFITLGLILAAMNYFHHKSNRASNIATQDVPHTACGACHGCTGCSGNIAG